MATLIFLTGPTPGRHFPLGRRTTVVGRDEGVPLQINDERVSRKHFQVRWDAAEQQFCVLDMQSTHGTFVNGRRITTDRVLADGDEIGAGDVKLLFTLEDFADAQAALSYWKTAGQRGKTTLPE